LLDEGVKVLGETKNLEGVFEVAKKKDGKRNEVARSRRGKKNP